MIVTHIKDEGHERKGREGKERDKQDKATSCFLE